VAVENCLLEGFVINSPYEDGSSSHHRVAELLSERAAPELVYLKTKFTSLISYGLTVELLGEVPPLRSQINTIGVRLWRPKRWI